jgi:hypothetical protein
MDIIEANWYEDREIGFGRCERFYVSAERTSTGWIFEERSSWEVQYYRVPSSEDLEARAAAELEKQKD